MNQIPSKEQLLMALYEQQQKILPLMTSADTYKNQGDLNQAVTAYEQLIGVLNTSLQIQELNNQHYPDSPFDIQPTVSQMLNALNIEADVIDALGYPDPAEARRQAARQMADKYLQQADLAEQERQRASTLIAQGRFNEALVALTAARDVFQERQDPLKTASVTISLAGILEWLGDYERARAEVTRASEFIAAFTAGDAASVCSRLGSILQGNYQVLEQAAELQRIRIELEQILARSNRYLGNYPEAERQFQVILPQLPQEIQPAIATQVAFIAVESGRYAEGLAAIEQLEPYFTGLMRPKLGVMLSMKGEALLRLGRPVEALPLLEAAVQDLAQYREADGLWKAQWRQARALAALNHRQEALTVYTQAVEVVKELRKSPLGYRLDSTYLKDKLPLFEAAIGLACSNGEAELCCRFIESIKSRTLTAVLGIPAGGASPKAGILDPKMDDRLTELTSQLDALEYTAYNAGASDGIQQRIGSLQAQRADLLEQIRFSDPRWRSLSEPLPFDLNGLLDVLKQRQQAALTLFYQPGQITCVLLQDGRCQVAKTLLSEATKKALATYQANLQAPKPKPEQFDLASLGLQADHLLPANLLESAIHAKSLVIIPHGLLHLLPWAGMTFRGRRLFESCPLGILPNLSCLPSLSTDFSPTPRAALIGAPDYKAIKVAPLLQAEVELRDIEQIYLMNAGLIDQLYLGKQATEANFWKLAKHPDAPHNLLHISSHGVFETGDPMSSGLLFSDSKADAAEIMRAGLRYDEVILSACSTGYRPTEVGGVALSGDDILGLPGALLEAGVRSVLVSIPPAREDASQRFMTLYHERRAEGVSPLLACQAVQKEMLKDGAFPPYLWVGFTVYGCQ